MSRRRQATTTSDDDKRRDKRRRQRRWGVRLVKNEFIFYQRNLRLFRSVRFANGSKNVLKLNICNDGVQFQMEIRKISRRHPRFVDDAEFSHFTLFYRGPWRQRNVQRFITHVHSYCFAHFSFLTHIRRRRRGRRLVKNVFQYFRILHLFRSIQRVCWY